MLSKAKKLPKKIWREKNRPILAFDRREDEKSKLKSPDIFDKFQPKLHVLQILLCFRIVRVD